VVKSSKPPVLFLSHAGVDTDRAIVLARLIEEIPEARRAGLQVWVDRRPDGSARLLPGKPWMDQLEQAIQQEATAFAVLITPRGVHDWVRMEVRSALSRVVDAQRDGQLFPFIPVLDGGAIADLPPFARTVQGVTIDESGEGLADLVRTVLRLGPAAVVPLVDEPFRGLEAFEAEHAALFFGREEETRELVRRLRNTELVIVTGDSGSGKSSLVKAGLIPAWREGVLADSLSPRPDSRLWHVVEMRPGSDPFEGLLQGALQAGRDAGVDRAELLAVGDKENGIRSRNADRVRDALLLSRPKGAKLLLVVDQLEELWTSLRDGFVRNSFLDLLLALARPGDRETRVVATFRRDFFHLHSDHDGLKARLMAQSGARFGLGALSDGSLAEVVVKPLRLAGAIGPDPETLAKALGQDAQREPANLALVQMALFETWQRREQHRSLLEAYQNIGRLEGALATAAVEVYWNPTGNSDWLNGEERALAEALFMRLARLGDRGGATRRAARLDDLDEATREVAVKLSTRGCRRLLVGTGAEPADDGSVELAHEQLLTQWPDYRFWLWGTATTAHPQPDLQRETDKRTFDRLMDRSALWEARGRNETDLAQGTELRELEELGDRRGSWLSTAERRFIDAGIAVQQERQRQQLEIVKRERAQLAQIHNEQTQRARLQRRAAALISILMLSAGALLVLAVQGFRSLHQARSQFLVSTAETLANDGQLDRALRLALLANLGDWLRPPHPNAEGILGSIAYRMTVEAILEGHPGTVHSASFSADGSRVLTMTKNGSALIWGQDAEGQWKATLLDRPLADIKIASFSSDGRRVLTGSVDGIVRVWHQDAEGYWMATPLGGHTGSITAAKYSPDGLRILTSSTDGPARVWEQRAPGRWTSTPLGGYDEAIFTASFSPDGRRIVTGSWQGSVRVWEQDLVGRWEAVVVPLERPAGSIRVASFSPDGQRILTSSDEVARLWHFNAEGGWVMTPLKGHRGAIRIGSFSPNGRRILTVSTDTARVWQQNEEGRWEAGLVEENDKEILSATFSPDGFEVLTGSIDGIARQWHQDEDGRWAARLLKGHESGIWTAGYSPDGHRILTGSEDGTARLWQRYPEKSYLLQSGVLTASFSPDGGRVLTGSQNGDVRLWRQNLVGRWIPTWLEGHQGKIHTARFSPNGDRVVTASDHKTARIWRQDANGQWKATLLEGHQGAVNTASFSSDGRRILTGAADSTVRVWEEDMEGRWTATVLDGIEGEEIRIATFSPDGHRVLAVAGENTVLLWHQLASSRWTSALLEKSEFEIRTASFSPDGRGIITGGVFTSLKVWRQSSEEHWIATSLAGQGPVIWTANFSQDGSRILANFIASVEVWQADSQGGWQSSSLEGIEGSVQTATFSPDGRRVLTSSDDKSFQIWQRDTDGRWTATMLSRGLDVIHFASFSPDRRKVLAISLNENLRIFDIRYLAGELDWAEAEGLPRAQAICREVLGQGLVEPTATDSETLPIRYPLRTVTKADAAAIPAIGNLAGYDVCTSILNNSPWWKALLFWKDPR
jgi:WD40 repeat protein